MCEGWWEGVSLVCFFIAGWGGGVFICVCVFVCVVGGGGVRQNKIRSRLSTKIVNPCLRVTIKGKTSHVSLLKGKLVSTDL